MISSISLSLVTVLEAIWSDSKYHAWWILWSELNCGLKESFFCECRTQITQWPLSISLVFKFLVFYFKCIIWLISIKWEIRKNFSFFFSLWLSFFWTWRSWRFSLWWFLIFLWFWGSRRWLRWRTWWFSSSNLFLFLFSLWRFYNLFLFFFEFWLLFVLVERLEIFNDGLKSFNLFNMRSDNFIFFLNDSKLNLRINLFIH